MGFPKPDPYANPMRMIQASNIPNEAAARRLIHEIEDNAREHGKKEAKEEAKLNEKALRNISDHGYMLYKISGGEELEHVMDWMINTAKLALEGLPLPELKDRRYCVEDPDGVLSKSECPPCVDKKEES